MSKERDPSHFSSFQILPILMVLASSSGGSVKRQSEAEQKEDGWCGQDALWSPFTDSVTWPWMTELTPGQGSPQLDCGSDTCLWPNEAAEAMPHLRVLFTQEDPTSYILLEWRPNRKATHLAWSSVLSTPPRGRRLLGFACWEVGPGLLRSSELNPF